jgi:hypothetical protein
MIYTVSAVPVLPSHHSDNKPIHEAVVEIILEFTAAVKWFGCASDGVTTLNVTQICVIRFEVFAS